MAEEGCTHSVAGALRGDVEEVGRGAADSFAASRPHQQTPPCAAATCRSKEAPAEAAACGESTFTRHGCGTDRVVVGSAGAGARRRVANRHSHGHGWRVVPVCGGKRRFLGARGRWRIDIPRGHDGRVRPCGGWQAGLARGCRWRIDIPPAMAGRVPHLAAAEWVRGVCRVYERWAAVGAGAWGGGRSRASTRGASLIESNMPARTLLWQRQRAAFANGSPTRVRLQT